MEHKIYTEKPLRKPGFFQKVLGYKIKENALIELNNLLATRELLQLTVEDVHQIATRYQVNFQADFDQELPDFYKIFLQSCLEDKFLSDAEFEALRHLKFLLGLNDKEVEMIHQELAGRIYKTEVEKVIGDGELDESERIFIEKLQTDLKLPQEVATRIYQSSGQELIKSFMSNAISDARLTPEEERELQAIARNLNAELKMDEATKSDLEKYKLYWQIENDEMPELVVDLNIPRNEKCYFVAPNTVWYERHITEVQSTHNLGGLRLKIAKGLYWRSPKENAKQITHQEWQHLDQGTLYLTNKRIFFRGEHGDRIVLLNRIFDFTVYANGIEIEKDRDKNPFFQFERHTDIMAMLLGKAISQLRS